MGAKVVSNLVCGSAGFGAIRLGPGQFRYPFNFADIRDGLTHTWQILDVPSGEEVTFDRAGIQLQNGGSIPAGLDLIIDQIGGGFSETIDIYDREMDFTLQGDKRFQFQIDNGTSDYQTVGAFVDVIIATI